MYIYKAAVVGGGAMGGEIAQTISFSGIPVVVKDVDEARVQYSLDTVRKIYQRRVEKGKMTAEDVEARMALVSGTTSYEAFTEVDIVIEAVPEQMEIKQRVFRELDAVTPPSAILASNTSSLSISALGAATKRPGKVIGMHFFYPAHVMKLVEVIPGLDTSEETTSDVTTFAESLRKLPIRVNECPGFLVNRLLMPYLNEAAYCLQEGAASPKTIDEAMTGFGMPLGPFALVDTLGFDVCHHVVQILKDAYYPRMEPAPLWEAIFTQGRLGVKSGGGFYLYGDRAGQPDKELEDLLATIRTQHPQRGTPFTPNRLLLPMINEAILCVEERITSAAEIDLAMLAGIGFPQSTGGLLHYADALGLDVVLRELQTLAGTYGPRFWPAPLLKRKVGAGHLGKQSGRGFFDYSAR